MDTDANPRVSEGLTGLCFKSLVNFDRRMTGACRIVFMRVRIAEIDKNAVPEILCDIASELTDRADADLPVPKD